MSMSSILLVLLVLFIIVIRNYRWCIVLESTIVVIISRAVSYSTIITCAIIGRTIRCSKHTTITHLI